MKCFKLLLLGVLFLVSNKSISQQTTFLYLCPVSGGPANQKLPPSTELGDCCKKIRDSSLVYCDFELKIFIGARPLTVESKSRIDPPFFYIKDGDALAQLAGAYDGIYVVGIGFIDQSNAVAKSNYLTRTIFKNGYDDYYCKGFSVILK